MSSVIRQTFTVNGNQQRSANRMALSLQASRPQLQRKKTLNLHDMINGLGKDNSKNPSVANNTVSHLSARRTEISQWQGRISVMIDQVDHEITELEKVKHIAESCLQDVQLYSQLMSKRTVLSDSSNPTIMRQGIVFTELQNGQQQTDHITDGLEAQICILNDKLRSLYTIRDQLCSDFLDKREALKLTTKCVILPMNAVCQQQSTSPYDLTHVSYDQWLSHCKDLKMVAEGLINDSSNFRVKLRYTLPNLRNVQKEQHRCITDSLKKSINQLNKTQQKLVVEKNQTLERISDLTKEGHKVGEQITNCKSKLHDANRRLDILNQRQRFELCRDTPYNSLLSESQAWIEKINELQGPLKQSEKNLQQAEKRLSKVEDKMSENSQALEVVQDCLYRHERVTPCLVNTVRLTNRPKISTGQL